ncbi:MAG: DUF1501 domain-containing protein [Acidimicrobiales bacterium]|nr:DUF1501 domain-containing protein [Acidimicrobiales bacterium]
MYEQFPSHLRDGIARLGDDPEFEDVHAALSTPVDERGLTRRRFLQAAAATGGATALSFGPLSKMAAAITPLGEGDPILIVVQLGGGNDGVNTVVPALDPAYARMRRATSVASRAISLGEGGLYLHPALPKLAARYRQRKVAIVRGVGNVALEHSHVDAMATWMAGTASPDRSTGWIGRLLDTMPDSNEGLRGVALDAAVPLHMLGTRCEVSALGATGPFGSNRSRGAEVALFDALTKMGAGTGRGGWSDAIGGVNKLTMERASDFATAFAGGGPTDDSLSAQLYRAARVINANVGVRVLGATLASFDTHRDQAWMHNHLLEDFDAAIDGFYRTLDPRWADQVVIMTFSEFGRRAADNGSGTDHGTSAPLFVIGDRVRGGLHGTQPSMTDLDSRGDLRVHVDFRTVYASVLGGWMGVDPKPILGADYGSIGLFTSRPAPPRHPYTPAESKFSPFRDAGAFIDQQYDDFLGRLPTPANRARWITRVRTGQTSIPSALREFYYAGSYARAGAEINRIMFCLTGGPATFEQLQRWMPMRESMGLRAVVAEMIHHPVARGRYTRLWGYDLVDRLNRHMTGIAPSKATVDYWFPKINGNQENGSVDFITAVSSTPSAKVRYHLEAVAACGHTAMLRRAPASSQARLWGSRLRAGESTSSMFWYFYRVPEYRRRFG